MPVLKGKKEKILVIILCVIALIGFFIPAMNIEVNILDRSMNNSFSITSFFNRADNQFIGRELPQTELFGFSSETSLFAGVSTKFIISVVAYLITLISIVALIIITLIGKLKKTGMVISVVSLASFIYLGVVVSTISESLYEALENVLENTLGFYAFFIDVSNMITINLGFGYWVTLFSIGLILLLKITDPTLFTKNNEKK